MKHSTAEVIREYGPFSGADKVHGVTFDGQHLYQIGENRIQKIDPNSGKVLTTIPAPGDGGDSGMAWAEGCCG